MKNLYLILFLLFMFSKMSFAAEDQRRQIYTPPSSSPPKVTTSDIPKLVQVQAPLPKYPDPAIVEVQRQLQDIARIQQTLQTVRQQEILEIQRITEQARLHQQILEDLSAAALSENRERQGEAVDEAIRREKIELIEKEANKNIKFLEKIKEKGKAKKKEKGKKAEKAKSVEKPKAQEPAPQAQPQQEATPKQKKPFWWWNSSR